MPRRTTSSRRHDTPARPALTTTRARAAQLLTERIADGQKLLGREMRSEEEFAQVEKEYFTWDSDTLNLLEDLYTTSDKARRYNGFPVAFVGGPPNPLHKRIADLRNDVERKVADLSSFRETLELMPAPDEAQPRPAPHVQALGEQADRAPRRDTPPDTRYDVAISFAGEDRACAEAIADALRRRNIEAFYDGYEKANLWGRNLYTHLSDVYQHRARYCIMLLSQQYARKAWTTHEREAAQARAFQESQEYILPIRLDDTVIPGILPTISYLRWQDETPESIADAVQDKLGLPRATVSHAPTGPPSTSALLDEALSHAVQPDQTLWERATHATFMHRLVYERTRPPEYMIVLRPTVPIRPIPIADDEQADHIFKQLCVALFGEADADAFLTEQDGITFDPFAAGVASADDNPPFACAFVDGSIGLRDRLSFTGHWEGNRPMPLLIDLPLLWKLLRRGLLTAARWPREVGGYAGALEIELSLGNLADSVTVYPANASVPRRGNSQPTWDVPHVEWPADQDVNDLLDRLFASLARHLQFGAYPRYRKAIRDDAAE